MRTQQDPLHCPWIVHGSNQNEIIAGAAEQGVQDIARPPRAELSEDALRVRLRPFYTGSCSPPNTAQDVGQRRIVSRYRKLLAGKADAGWVGRLQRQSVGRRWLLLRRWLRCGRSRSRSGWRASRLRQGRMGKPHWRTLSRSRWTLLLRRKLLPLTWKLLRLRRWLCLDGWLRLIGLRRRNAPHPVVDRRRRLSGLASLRLLGIRALSLSGADDRITEKHREPGNGDTSDHAGLCYSKGSQSPQQTTAA